MAATRLRKALIAFGVLAVAATITSGLIVAWLGPRTDVKFPGPDASPQDVVQAYNEAVNARDFVTSNEVDRRPDLGYGRWSLHPLRTEDVRFERTTGDDRHAHVVFTAILSGGDGSLPSGRQLWGYVLERGSDDRWYIVDAGVV